MTSLAICISKWIKHHIDSLEEGGVLEREINLLHDFPAEYDQPVYLHSLNFSDVNSF